MLRATLTGVALGLLLAGCNCGALDGPGQVHDLRMLAMRAQPPEQVFGRDAGAVTVTALIANPSGTAPVSCKWTTCAQQDSATSRCLETSMGYALLGESMVMTGPDGAEPSITFAPDPVLLTSLRQLDVYRGLGGLRQIVQLEIRVGADSVVGIKRVVFLLAAETPPALNVNPTVGPLEFNDAGWAPDASVSFAVRPQRMPGMPGMVMMTGEPRNQLAVLEDKSLIQPYVVHTFSGDTRMLQESWQYNFFATHGSFSPQSANGGGGLFGMDGGIETRWSRVAGEDGGSGPTTVWIVVRDGRGGENWTTRQALAP